MSDSIAHVTSVRGRAAPCSQMLSTWLAVTDRCSPDLVHASIKVLAPAGTRGGRRLAGGAPRVVARGVVGVADLLLLVVPRVERVRLAVGLGPRRREEEDVVRRAARGEDERVAAHALEAARLAPVGGVAVAELAKAPAPHV